MFTFARSIDQSVLGLTSLLVALSMMFQGETLERSSSPHRALSWFGDSDGTDTSSTDTADSDEATTMLLGIFSHDSTADAAERRSLIRKTYLANTDTRICSLNVFLSGENADCRVAYTFVLGGWNKEQFPDAPTDHVNDDEPLVVLDKKVSDDEDDVTYLNIKENMNDGKSYTWFKYAAYLEGAKDDGTPRIGATNRRAIHYVAKADADTLISMNALLDYMNQDLPPSPYNNNFFGGIPTANVAKNHMYMQGQLYFISLNLAKYIGYELTGEERQTITRGYWEEKHAKLFVHEDVSVGTLVYSHPRPIKLVSVAKGARFWRHPVKGTDEWMNYWDDGNFNPDTTVSKHHDWIQLPYNSACRVYGVYKGS